MSENIIDFNNVSFSYNKHLVLKDVNLHIKPRNSICIVGPNGGGKTTFLKLILGLLKPQTGNIKVFGMEPKKIVNRIGYMPQRIYFDPMFPISVMDVVLMGRLNKKSLIKWYSKKDKEKALWALEKLHLIQHKDKVFGDLSGGQQQRAMIARALACEPELLILDEPTANIDVAMEAELFETLDQLSSEMTLFMVSHDFNFVSKMVNEVICVNKSIAMHPTSMISEDLIKEMYGTLKIIRHNHDICEHC